MLHKMISLFGLGILGIDPITAIYMLSMGLRKEIKFKISLFMFSFMAFSILIGAAAAVIFGTSAVDLLKRVTPGDNSPVWAVLEFAVSLVILFSVFRNLFNRNKEKNKKKDQIIDGSSFKYIATGFVFATTSFTDPTYYAVILLGGETNNFLLAALMLTIWFLVSQFMAVIVYIANQINLLNRLNVFIEELKNKNLKAITNIFFAVLMILSVLLIVDSGFYLFNGKYLF